MIVEETHISSVSSLDLRPQQNLITKDELFVKKNDVLTYTHARAEKIYYRFVVSFLVRCHCHTPPLYFLTNLPKRKLLHGIPCTPYQNFKRITEICILYAYPSKFTFFTHPITQPEKKIIQIMTHTPI